MTLDIQDYLDYIEHKFGVDCGQVYELLDSIVSSREQCGAD